MTTPSLWAKQKTRLPIFIHLLLYFSFLLACSILLSDKIFYSWFTYKLIVPSFFYHLWLKDFPFNCKKQILILKKSGQGRRHRGVRSALLGWPTASRNEIHRHTFYDCCMLFSIIFLSLSYMKMAVKRSDSTQETRPSSVVSTPSCTYCPTKWWKRSEKEGNFHNNTAHHHIHSSVPSPFLSDGAEESVRCTRSAGRSPCVHRRLLKSWEKCAHKRKPLPPK